jgi:hypothetical protein
VERITVMTITKVCMKTKQVNLIKLGIMRRKVSEWEVIELSVMDQVILNQDIINNKTINNEIITDIMIILEEDNTCMLELADKMPLFVWILKLVD